MPKVSIIVPVYNAAKTLQRSLDSIAAQSLRDFEVIFVDDCSTDDTPLLLRRFAEESGISCKLIQQPANAGVAAARNRGLDAAGGEYLAWVDADDIIAPDALEKALAAGGDADIIGWDWRLGLEENARYMRQADYDTPLEAMKALMGGTMRWNLWLSMSKRSLWTENNIRFIDGSDMGEDMMVMLTAFSVAGKVKQIHESLYSYDASDSSSVSRRFDERRRKEVTVNVNEVEKMVSECRYADELKSYIDHLKLYVKLPLIVSEDKDSYRIWYGWFPEANGAAMENKALPFRTRLLQWMASKRFWWGVMAYNVLVYKFIYGIVYNR